MEKAHFRYRAMLVTNPLSKEMKKRRATDDDISRQATFTSGWSREEWYRFYPNGIPEFSSEEFWARYKTLMTSDKVRFYDTKKNGFVCKMDMITSKIGCYWDNHGPDG